MSFNRLTSLDVSGAANLTELYCRANELTSLDVSHNTLLTNLDTSDNNLSTLDLSANTAIMVVRCERNYLDTQEGSALWTQIQNIDERAGTLVSYSPQKMKADFVLNASDVADLTQFANQGNNLSKLEWDLSKPETWEGVQWVYANNEYHVQTIFIDDLALTGDLILSGMTYLTHVSCNNNNLTSIDVSDSDRLTALSVRSAGISSLNISDTPALRVFSGEDNYLSISDIIDDMLIIETRENVWVSYMNQRLPYDITITTPGLTYDEASRMLVLGMIRLSAEGNWPDSVFIEVNKHTASNGMMYVSSETVVLNSSGVGIYSFAASPVVIGVVDEYAEILVYTDSSRVRLVARLIVRPVSFEF